MERNCPKFFMRLRKLFPNLAWAMKAFMRAQMIMNYFGKTRKMMIFAQSARLLGGKVWNLKPN